MDRVEFDETEIVGFCIHLEKQRALSKVADHFKRKGKYDYTNSRKLSRTYNALLWKMIRESLEGFLLPHGCAAQDLVFQCDADCRDFASDQGWHHENRGQRTRWPTSWPWETVMNGSMPEPCALTSPTALGNKRSSDSNDGPVSTSTPGQFADAPRQPWGFAYGVNILPHGCI